MNQLSPAAKKRLKELREMWVKARDEGNKRRMLEVEHMGRSIKDGETYYIHG